MFCHRKEPVMTNGVEMSFVGTVITLEINLAESLTGSENIALPSGIEDRDTIAATYLQYGINYLLSCTAYESLTSPWREKEDKCMRIFLDEPAA